MIRKALDLTPTQQAELKHVRDHDKKPYLRERASALLKIAAGQSPYQVSQTGLLQKRDPHTVYEWLDRYQQAGVGGLAIKAGRGRKAAFSPSQRDGRPSRG